MYVTILILLFIFKNLIAESLHSDVDAILQVTDEFDVKHPYILASGNCLNKKWIKILSKHSQYSGNFKYKNVSGKENENWIIFVDENNSDKIVEFFSILKSTSIVISKGSYLHKFFSESNLEINQPIYFYNQDTDEVKESYTINNHNIHRKIGKITKNGFQWTMNSNFLLRRSDFYGLTLKAMVELQGMDMNADNSYLTSAPYFSGTNVTTAYLLMLKNINVFESFIP